MTQDVEILHLLVSGGHNYRGRHGKGSLINHVEEFSSIECVAGRGIRGDRYFDYKEDFKGQITFFQEETRQAVKEHFGLASLQPSAFRRNVVIRGVVLKDLIGHRFTMQGLEFEGAEEAKPCYWMDEACAEGVEDFLKGRGGLRARIRVGGNLQCGPAHLDRISGQFAAGA